MLKVKSLLIAAAAALGMSSALAGYAYPKPPSGYSRVGDAWTYRAANASEWLGSTVRTNATLNVAGRAVTVPAAMRMAANAPRFAAAAMASPVGLALTTAAVFAPILSDLWQQHKVRWNDSSNQWEKVDELPSEWEQTGVTFSYAGSPPYGGYATLQEWADVGCKSWGGPSAYAVLEMLGGAEDGFPFNRYCRRPKPGSPLEEQITPLSPPQVLPYIEPLVDPEDVPKIVPAVPVEYPIINPSDDPVPQPRPMRVPLGDPVQVPNPAYDPVTNPSAPPYIWERPYIVINPSPSPDSPWRVDVQPEKIQSPDKEKLPDSPENPLTDGDPLTNPAPDPGPLPPVTTPETSTPPQEIITCGLPTSPPCKIDEAGTPQADPAKTQEEIDSVFGEIKTCLQDIKTCLPALPQLSWSFSLPSGCSPLSFDTQVGPVIQIDMCQHQSTIHDLMSMLWAAAGLFGAVSLVARFSAGGA